MRVFLHIGYPKTGSSAIQSHIFSNRGWLEAQGVYVPRAGYASGLGHTFLTGQDSLPFLRKQKLPALYNTDQLAALICELEACADKGFEKALISWEGLAILNEEKIAAICEALQDYDVTLLAYVRDQVKLYESGSFQELENQWQVSPDTFFKTNCLSTDALNNYHFSESLALWRKRLSKGANIRVRLFERSSLVGSNVVSDFLDWLDLRADENFALQSEYVNRSLDSRGAALILLARSLRIGPQELVKLTSALSDVAWQSEGSSRTFLSDADKEQIRQHYRESNARLFSEFRPENITADFAGFLDIKSTSSRGTQSSEFDYLKSVYEALGTPGLERWDGGPLLSRRVGLLTRAPNTGWRNPADTGAWSVGAQSKIAFLLPETDSSAGPSGLILRIFGYYYEDHRATKVTVEGHTDTYDLRDALLEIKMTDSIRNHGVHLLLEHQFPSATKENIGAEKDIAFKLASISYGFVWNQALDVC